MWKWVLRIAVAALLFAVGSAGYWIYKQIDAQQQVTVERMEKFKNRKLREDIPHAGYIAPKFALPNAENQSVSLDTSKPAVVVFWTSWSSHCQKELDTLEELYRQNQADVQFLLINATKYDTEEEARKLLANKSIEKAALFDPDGAVTDDYVIKVYPTGFIIGTDGKIKDRWVGNVTGEEWKAKLQTIEQQKQ